MMTPATTSSSIPGPANSQASLIALGASPPVPPSTSQQPRAGVSTTTPLTEPTLSPSLSISFKTWKPPRLDSTRFEKGWLDHKFQAMESTRSRPIGRNIRLEYHSGDIFAAPPRTLLIHACNALGKWGAGIAVEFKRRYPRAFAIYNRYCTLTWNPKAKHVPSGSALLIPPVDSQGHWIGCLFTSKCVGKKKDREDEIVSNTVSAVQDLLQLVENVDGEAEHGQVTEIGHLRMCKINSGKFGVDWQASSHAIGRTTCLPNWRDSIEVWVREGEEDDQHDTTVHAKGGDTWVYNRKSGFQTLIEGRQAEDSNSVSQEVQTGKSQPINQEDPNSTIKRVGFSEQRGPNEQRQKKRPPIDETKQLDKEQGKRLCLRKSL